MFIHGYNGHATDTWKNFTRPIDRDARTEHVDLVFYGYESQHRRASVNAGIFASLLERIFDEPYSLISTRDPDVVARPPDFAYDRVLIVAHSLGAVVAREAIVGLYHRDRRKLDDKDFDLMLFAPAHRGASVLRVGSWIPRVDVVKDALAVLGKFIVRYDLEETSGTLAGLEAATMRLIGENRTKGLIAKQVIFGSQEKIVNPSIFGADPAPIVHRNKGHVDICKPASGFPLPVRWVLEAL